MKNLAVGIMKLKDIFKPHPKQKEFFERSEDKIYFGGAQPTRGYYTEVMKYYTKYKTEWRQNMSLNRDQWIEMWQAIKQIEANAEALKTTNALRSRLILSEVKFIKNQIESVIGQME